LEILVAPVAAVVVVAALLDPDCRHPTAVVSEHRQQLVTPAAHILMISHCYHLKDSIYTLKVKGNGKGLPLGDDMNIHGRFKHFWTRSEL
jgi:hypothetical protein